jgi:hypothetical protein
MGGWKTGGAELFIGITGSGKTTKAKERLSDAATKWKIPTATLDLEMALDWADVPHAQTVEEVLTDLFVRRVSPKVWSPKTESERATFFKAVGYWGGIGLLIDGLPMIADAHNLDEELRMMLYRHRHGKLGPTFHFMVAQRASLIHRHIFAACSRVYVFRQAPGADADRIDHEFGIPPDKSTALERGKYEPVELGFAEEEARANVDDRGKNSGVGTAGLGIPSSAVEDQSKRVDPPVAPSV